jgi:hypothetical protein
MLIIYKRLPLSFFLMFVSGSMWESVVSPIGVFTNQHLPPRNTIGNTTGIGDQYTYILNTLYIDKLK